MVKPIETIPEGVKHIHCIGIGGSSAMGAMLFSINPFLAFVQRFVPRMLDGLLLGYIFQFVRRRTDGKKPHLQPRVSP